MRNAVRVVVFLFAVMLAASTAAAGTDALPSWNDGAAKSAIIAFVQTATDKSSVKFVPPEQRIAVFDNDGTLWASHPIYVQLSFALDRVKALAPKYTDSGKGAHLEMLVLHDDARREYAYTCDTKVGRLCKGLALAKKRGWLLISMKNDWKTIFPEK